MIAELPFISRTKTALVWLLGWVLAWHPSIAMRLGKLVTWVWAQVWGGFGRA